VVPVHPCCVSPWRGARGRLTLAQAAAATPRPNDRTPRSTIPPAVHGLSDLQVLRLVQDSRSGLDQRCSLQAAHAMDPIKWPDPVASTDRSCRGAPGAGYRPGLSDPRGQAATCSLGLRQPSQPRMATPTCNHRADRPTRDPVLDPAGTPPLAGGAVAVVAELLQAAAGPVGSGIGAVVCVRPVGLCDGLLQAALPPARAAVTARVGPPRYARR
jgi:hypothetical protein